MSDAFITDEKELQPSDPIDPTYHPTCLSGAPARDEHFEDAIAV
jgi:hypothetical protein